MSRRKRRPPLRQPRGPRATLPPLPPRPEKPTALDIHVWGTGCEDCERWTEECTCNSVDPAR